GSAITLPLADYVVTDHDPVGGQLTVPDGAWQWFVNDYGEKNSFRMAAYHRMDVGIQFHKKMKRWERTFELSFYNLYNRKNPFFYYIGYDSISNQRKLRQVSLFPIIPSVSWNIKF
ncbi:MAG TPA: TonB-dependent receptor, partial [Bacteroidia bacterium]|nr:TonB-dependent receptor [Bacteroidia bacterium]